MAFAAEWSLGYNSIGCVVIDDHAV